MLKRTLVFTSDLTGRHKLSSLAQGQKLFLISQLPNPADSIRKAEEIPIPKLQIDCVEPDIVLNNQARGSLETFFQILPYDIENGPQNTIFPSSFVCQVCITGGEIGTLSCDLKDANWHCVSDKPKEKKYEFTIKNYNSAQTFIFCLVYKFPNLATDALIEVEILHEVATQQAIPHIMAELKIYAKHLGHIPTLDEIVESYEHPEKLPEISGIYTSYKIKRFLNHTGATSVMAVAEEIASRRECILKILNPTWGLQGVPKNEQEKDQQHLTMLNNIFHLSQEGKLLTEIEHPYIVKAWECFRVGQLYVIVMEYLQGETLEDFIHQASLTPKNPRYHVEISEALKYFFQITHALDYIHLFKILHHDIKPANIMLVTRHGSTEKRAVLLDFGAISTRARLSDDLGAGTLEFLPSESFNPPQYIYNKQSEIFALGMIFYLTLTGRHPYVPTMYYAEKWNSQEQAQEFIRLFRHNVKYSQIPALTTYNDIPDLPNYIQVIVHEEMLKPRWQDRNFSLNDIGRYFFLALQQYKQRQIIEDIGNAIDRCGEMYLLAMARKLAQIKNADRISPLVYNCKILQEDGTPFVSVDNQSYLVKFADRRCFLDNIDEQEQYYIRFKRQVEVLLRLCTFHVPNIRFVNFSPDLLYFIMDKVPGETVRQHLEQGSQQGGYISTLSQGAIYRSIQQIAEVLTALESLETHLVPDPNRRVTLLNRIMRGITGDSAKIPVSTLYHRNLTPDNIMVDNLGNILVTGWGQMKNIAANAQGSTTASRALVRDNSLYLAPEYIKNSQNPQQANVNSYSVKCDIFSVGILLHLLLTGRHAFLRNVYPFPRVATATMVQTREDDIVANTPATINSAITNPQVRDLLTRMLSLNPNQRPTPEELYQTLGEILQALPPDERDQSTVGHSSINDYLERLHIQAKQRAPEFLMTPDLTNMIRRKCGLTTDRRPKEPTSGGSDRKRPDEPTSGGILGWLRGLFGKKKSS